MRRHLGPLAKGTTWSVCFFFLKILVCVCVHMCMCAFFLLKYVDLHVSGGQHRGRFTIFKGYTPFIVTIKYWQYFSVLYNMFLFLIHFMHSSLYLFIPHLFIAPLPSFPTLLTTSLFSMTLFLCYIDKFVFLGSIYVISYSICLSLSDLFHLEKRFPSLSMWCKWQNCLLFSIVE